MTASSLLGEKIAPLGGLATENLQLGFEQYQRPDGPEAMRWTWMFSVGGSFAAILRTSLAVQDDSDLRAPPTPALVFFLFAIDDLLSPR
jgi:hypothetical protein